MKLLGNVLKLRGLGPDGEFLIGFTQNRGIKAIEFGGTKQGLNDRSNLSCPF
jgi:hypothetical protein